MKSVREIFNVPGLQLAAGGCLLVVLLAAVHMVAQTRGATGGGAGNSLGISMGALFKGKPLTDGTSVQAPAVIYIFPHLETALKPQAGDKVKIDFFANGQKLCSQKAVWQDEKRPPHRPGEAFPLWIMAAQFRVSECVWSNPIPGSYTLRAHATGLHGLSGGCGAAADYSCRRAAVGAKQVRGLGQRAVITIFGHNFHSN